MMIYFLSYMILINTALGLFNLLPIPPLDGSHVLENILPEKAALTFRRYRKNAPFILLGIFMMDRFMGTRIIATVLDWPLRFILGLFTGQNYL